MENFLRGRPAGTFSPTENKINILSLSLADTTEYGLLRLIVNNPELGKEKLSKDGFSTILTDVLVLKISHQSGSLQQLLKILSDNDVNIEYMYGLSIDGEDASVVLKASNLDDAEKVLTDNGIKTLSEEEIKSI